MERGRSCNTRSGRRNCNRDLPGEWKQFKPNASRPGTTARLSIYRTNRVRVFGVKCGWASNAMVVEMMEDERAFASSQMIGIHVKKCLIFSSCYIPVRGTWGSVGGGMVTPT